MPARIVVDGNNVMGSRPDGWWRDRAGASRRLAAGIARWAAGRPAAVTVVFDGAAPAGEPYADGVEVLHSGAGREADDLIAGMIAELVAAGPVCVVTSDAGLAARVRAHGAEVRGAGSLRRELDAS